MSCATLVAPQLCTARSKDSVFEEPGVGGRPSRELSTGKGQSAISSFTGNFWTCGHALSNPAPLCILASSLPISGPCLCHHVSLSNRSAFTCHTLAPPDPAILQGPPASSSHPDAALSWHAQDSAGAQDTVARDLLPFVLTLVSWCFQVNEGNSFLICDPLLQVELNQM